MKNSRADQIISYMKNNKNTASVNELCAALNVSDMTIRRDLKILEDEKRVLRHHGGATLVQAAPSQFRF